MSEKSTTAAPGTEQIVFAPLPGYTAQSQESLELVKVNKRLEEMILRQLDHIEIFSDIDRRWLATARTDIEKGFMAANRAIMRPQRLTGDL